MHSVAGASAFNRWRETVYIHTYFLGNNALISQTPTNRCMEENDANSKHFESKSCEFEHTFPYLAVSYLPVLCAQFPKIC